jgi:hypothetical protein
MRPLAWLGIVVAVAVGCQPAFAQAAPPPTPKASVALALDWLARHQAKHGGWDVGGWHNQCKADACVKGVDGNRSHSVGVSAMALLAFARAGHTHKAGPYALTLAKALAYLEQRFGKDGSIGLDPNYQESIYAHAIATQALASLYRQSKDPALAPLVKRALAFCLARQNPRSGWKYGRKGRSDTSVTGWFVMALHEVRAAGVAVPPESFSGALAWFQRATDSKGAAGYESPGGGSSFLATNDGKYEQVPTMTAMALLGRELCQEKKTPARAKGRKLLASSLPTWDARYQNLYYWHAATRALSYARPKERAQWNKALFAALLANQRTQGCAKGSWRATAEWCQAGGRVYATAINVCSLLAATEELPWKPRSDLHRGQPATVLQGKKQVEVLLAENKLRVYLYDAKSLPLDASKVETRALLRITRKGKSKQSKKRLRLKAVAAAPAQGRRLSYLEATLKLPRTWAAVEGTLTFGPKKGWQATFTFARADARESFPIFVCSGCKTKNVDQGPCTKCKRAVQ